MWKINFVPPIVLARVSGHLWLFSCFLLQSLQGRQCLLEIEYVVSLRVQENSVIHKVFSEFLQQFRYVGMIQAGQWSIPHWSPRPRLSCHTVPCQFPASKVSCVLKFTKLRKTSLINQEPRSERNVPCYIVFEHRFDEMWFLTVDPFARASMTSQSFPKDETAGLFSRTFIVKNIQFCDVNCGLFMRLHFSITCYYHRITTRFRQGIRFSRIQILFCASSQRTESTTNSLPLV